MRRCVHVSGEGEDIGGVEVHPRAHFCIQCIAGIEFSFVLGFLTHLRVFIMGFGFHVKAGRLSLRTGLTFCTGA
jgi:hypothetical protein